MAGGSAIRGSRVGAGPMGEAERGESAPRRRIPFFCANGHETRPAFAEEASVPDTWDCPRCGLPAGQSEQAPPPAPRNEPYKTHLAYVRERRTDADGELEAAAELGDDLVVGAGLDGVDLAGSDRMPLSLVDTVLRRCDLSAAVWQAVTLRQVELLDCRARGLRLSVDLAQDVYLSGCRFDQATLRIERVRGLVVFDGCVFTDAVVAGDLSSVVFTDCGFDDAEFAATKADGCDLRSSRLAGARGLLTLRGARITGDQSVAIAARLAAESGFVVED